MLTFLAEVRTALRGIDAVHTSISAGVEIGAMTAGSRTRRSNAGRKKPAVERPRRPELNSFFSVPLEGAYFICNFAELIWVDLCLDSSLLHET